MAKDLTGDGHGDLYVVGSNRLFIAKGDGTFREIGAKAAGLVRPAPDPDRPRADFDTGVSVGDVNRDGRLDAAVAEHYTSSANGRKIPAVSLYLNKGLNSKGNPIFQDVTTTAGLPSVAAKNGDVNINDYNNDGWPDIAAGVAGCRGRVRLFLRSLGLRNGVPRYAVPAGVGEVKGTAEPGDQTHHGLPVAAADYDKDGRLDVFYDFFSPTWTVNCCCATRQDPALALALARSRTGRWHRCQGKRLPGRRLGRPQSPHRPAGDRSNRRLTARVPDEAHFGLGPRTAVDVKVTLPPGSRGLATNGVIDLRNVPADRHLRLPSGC